MALQIIIKEAETGLLKLEKAEVLALAHTNKTWGQNGHDLYVYSSWNMMAIELKQKVSIISA